MLPAALLLVEDSALTVYAQRRETVALVVKR
jgi:hypothetical protein